MPSASIVRDLKQTSTTRHRRSPGDFSTTVNGTLRSTARVLAARLNGSIYATGSSSQEDAEQQLRSAPTCGTIEAIEKFLFVDAQAIVEQRSSRRSARSRATSSMSRTIDTRRRRTGEPLHPRPAIASHQLPIACETTTSDARESSGDSTRRFPNVRERAHAQRGAPRGALGLGRRIRQPRVDDVESRHFGSTRSRSRAAYAIYPIRSRSSSCRARGATRTTTFPFETPSEVDLRRRLPMGAVADAPTSTAYWEHRFFGTSYSGADQPSDAALPSRSRRSATSTPTRRTCGRSGGRQLQPAVTPR